MDEFLQRRCSDDVVNYSIYLNTASLDCNFMIRDLVEFKNKCLAFVLNETCNHIWQKQSFNLKLVEDSIPHLHGSTNFGDCIEDEWLIVSLLLKLTEVFPQLIATTDDTDGQFILIEAAEELPTWLTPETSDNRVFISSGVLHLLLQPTTPGEIPYSPIVNPSLSCALSTVSSYSSQTKASEQIMSCIQKRTKKILPTLNSQFVNVYIPKVLVHLLDHFPCFISACVESFYLRDPIDLRSCRIFNYVPPTDRVWTQIPMTRYHYAQLKQQHFIPDKRSGYVVEDDELSPKELKGIDLGMKIAHGCEISCSSRAKVSHVNNNLNHTLSQENSFECFIRVLQSTGYFRGEIEGSKLFQNLLEQAKKYYSKSIQDSCDNDDILSLLQSWKTQPFSCLQNLSIKNSLCDLPPESSDEWMFLEEKDVNEITEQINKGFSDIYKDDENDQSNKQYVSQCQSSKEEALHEIVGGIHAFVDNQSDYSGVEVPDSASVDIDCEAFLNSLQRILKVDRHGNPFVSNNLMEEDSDEFVSSDNDDENDVDQDHCNEYNDYINLMEDELKDTAVGKGFLKNKDTQFSADSNSSEIGENTLIDINLLENFLQGNIDEKGTSGPVTNLLGSMGVQLPD